jgi:hypothetical protein
MGEAAQSRARPQPDLRLGERHQPPGGYPVLRQEKYRFMASTAELKSAQFKFAVQIESI